MSNRKHSLDSNPGCATPASQHLITLCLEAERDKKNVWEVQIEVSALPAAGSILKSEAGI